LHRYTTGGTHLRSGQQSPLGGGGGGGGGGYGKTVSSGGGGGGGGGMFAAPMSAAMNPRMGGDHLSADDSQKVGELRADIARLEAEMRATKVRASGWFPFPAFSCFSFM
jgi:hypothetical protein